ncbi:hypothetical protein ACFX2I_011831 [Malus domestica]
MYAAIQKLRKGFSGKTVCTHLGCVL